MATQEIINLTDDLDENVTEGVETVRFFDPSTGVEREIELGEDNRAWLESVLAMLGKVITVSREVEAPKLAKAAKGDDRNKEIRAWAQANGFKIGDRGRIKAEIVEAFEAAQATPVKLVEVSDEAPEQESVTDGIVDADDLVEVEFPKDDVRPATEAELQEMLLDMAVKGQEPTADDLIMAEVDTTSDIQ